MRSPIGVFFLLVALRPCFSTTTGFQPPSHALDLPSSNRKFQSLMAALEKNSAPQEEPLIYEYDSFILSFLAYHYSTNRSRYDSQEGFVRRTLTVPPESHHAKLFNKDIPVLERPADDPTQPFYIIFGATYSSFTARGGFIWQQVKHLQERHPKAGFLIFPGFHSHEINSCEPKAPPLSGRLLAPDYYARIRNYLTTQKHTGPTYVSGFSGGGSAALSMLWLDQKKKSPILTRGIIYSPLLDLPSAFSNLDQLKALADQDTGSLQPGGRGFLDIWSMVTYLPMAWFKGELSQHALVRLLYKRHAEPRQKMVQRMIYDFFDNLLSKTLSFFPKYKGKPSFREFYFDFAFNRHTNLLKENLDMQSYLDAEKILSEIEPSSLVLIITLDDPILHGGSNEYSKRSQGNPVVSPRLQKLFKMIRTHFGDNAWFYSRGGHLAYMLDEDFIAKCIDIGLLRSVQQNQPPTLPSSAT